MQIRSKLSRRAAFVLSVVPLLAGAAVAAPSEGPRVFRITTEGEVYRLELSGTLGAPDGPFEARMFHVGAAPAARAEAGGLPIEVLPLTRDAGWTAPRTEPDATWGVTPRGDVTAVAIRVGHDRLEALLPAVDLSASHKAGICEPHDVAIAPLWVEVNGVPVELPDSMDELQQDPLSALTTPGRRTEGPAVQAGPFDDPDGFVGGFGRLFGLVLAALAPNDIDGEVLAKGHCSAPCMSCATGVLRMAGYSALMVTACGSVFTAGGATVGGCVLTMVVAHTSVADAALKCSECDLCRSRRRGTDRPCNCPCVGQPLCDCAEDCPDDQELPDDDLP